MLVITGRSCTGKDTVVNEIMKQLPRMITYTTRPMRDEEKNGVDYYYITEEDFKQKVEQGFFAEWQVYHTEFGDWFYGSSKDSYRREGAIILSPSGVKSVKAHDLGVVVCQIDAFDEIIKERQIKRNDNPEEALRRFEADKLDFVGVDEFVDFTVMNNGEYTPEFLSELILTAYYGYKQK